MLKTLIIKIQVLILLIISISWGQGIDTGPYVISLQGLQKSLSVHEKDLREIKNNKEFVSKREEILTMIWNMEEEIMGKEI